MSKTTDAIEALNDVQRKALRRLCGDVLEPADKKGWFCTSGKCRADTAAVLGEHDLAKIDHDGYQYIVKPTALGRRVAQALMACVLMLVMVSCGDKIQVAKTTLAFVNLGVETTKNVIKAVAAQKRIECLKKGTEGSPEFNKCYEQTAKVLAAMAKLEPTIDTTMENAAKYIKAAESGQSADYATAVRATVCLLTKIAEIIPGDGWAKLKKKIEMYIALAAAYACDKPSANTIAPATGHQLYVLKKGLELLREIKG